MLSINPYKFEKGKLGMCNICGKERGNIDFFHVTGSACTTEPRVRFFTCRYCLTKMLKAIKDALLASESDSFVSPGTKGIHGESFHRCFDGSVCQTPGGDCDRCDHLDPPESQSGGFKDE